MIISVSENIDRIEESVEDSFVIYENIPLPSIIEISLIEFCNRKCVFCPRSTEIAINQKHLYMKKSLLSKISSELKEIGFNGTVVFAGYGEPLASPLILEAIKEFSNNKLEIVTNGDLLTAEIIKQFNNNLLISVSMYDGPEQIKYLTELFKFAGFNNYILRERWYGSDKDYGLKLTNRAGVINIGNQPKINRNSPCFYPNYYMMVDWNGDIYQCCHNWQRYHKMGNIAVDSLLDVWNGLGYKYYRRKLNHGNRTILPCSKCNCSGTLHGKKHAEKWNEYYKSD